MISEVLVLWQSVGDGEQLESLFVNLVELEGVRTSDSHVFFDKRVKTQLLQVNMEVLDGMDLLLLPTPLVKNNSTRQLVFALQIMAILILKPITEQDSNPGVVLTEAQAFDFFEVRIPDLVSQKLNRHAIELHPIRVQLVSSFGLVGNV